MIGYVTLGTNEPRRAAAFYDSLLAELGARRIFELGEFIVWGTAPDKAALAITRPYDGGPASVGNGVMVALAVESPARVDAVHRKAMELGASDEGAPGARTPENFYAGYFRDPDGNKLNAYCFT